MDMKWSSIRGRIIRGFLIGFFFMGLITTIHYIVVARLFERLYFIETASELMNTILEMRRYEKNYFLYKEKLSHQENLKYTTKALLVFRDEREKITKAMGTDNYNIFLGAILDYQSLMTRIGDKSFWVSHQPDIENEIRKKGEKLVKAAGDIVSKQRVKTTAILRHFQYIPVFFIAALAALAIYMIHLVAKKIVVPLRQLEQITKKLARGDYSTLHIECNSADEMCNLITTFNTMVKELEDRQEEVLQSRKMAAIGTLTSGIAHELNNPINNISLCVDSYITDYGKLSDREQNDLLNDISNQAERAADIVRNLLDFSRAEKPALRPVSLKELMNSTIKLVKNQFALSGVKIDPAIPPHLPKIRGDRHNLEQVFVNLFVNSLQAMPNGGRLTVQAKDNGNFIEVVVADTGHGISPEDLSRIFDPFFSTKKVGEGTGLGLSVSYGIIKKHGGDIHVKSVPDVGTTFTIYLPKE